jgi:tRNA nucleotidyltransferase (CCA-adding enzyme)
MVMIKDIPSSVMAVCGTLHSYGYESYLVGGCVRDSMMGRVPNDWDVATNALPEKVMDIFADSIPTGLKHGTVTVRPVSNDDELIEVTTYRSDSTYSDGRRPDDVRFVTTIKEDLARRDFTINAMAFDPINEEFIDPFGGGFDLTDKVIVAVGDPVERFSEDGLRCLRAIRFGAQLGFKIEHNTFHAILPCIDTFAKVSKERVSSELLKIFSCGSSTRIAVAITKLMQSGILDEIVPEFAYCINCEQNAYHAMDVADHTLAVVAHCGENANPVVTLAAFFHDIGKPPTRTIHPKRGDGQFLGHEDKSAEMTFDIMTRLKFSNEIRDSVCHLIRHHLVMYESKWSNASVRRWVKRVGLENVEPLLQLYRADILGKGNAKIKQDPKVCDELLERVRSLSANGPIVTSTVDLAVNGNDIMTHFSIKPGTLVGNMLKYCLDQVLENPEANNKYLLLQMLACEYF